MANEVTTPLGLLSFPHLFVARAAVQGAEPRFSCTLIFDGDAQKHAKYLELKREVMSAIEEEWGSKAKDASFIKKLRLPFRDAAEKDYEGYGPGKIFINPWNKSKPGVIDRDLQDMTADQVWAGQLARAIVRPYTYNQSGNQGVSLSLVHVQIVRSDMPRLDGRRSAKDAFKGEDLPADLGGISEPGDDIPF